MTKVDYYAQYSVNKFSLFPMSLLIAHESKSKIIYSFLACPKQFGLIGRTRHESNKKEYQVWLSIKL